jgi:eukaryotic-like serine/threonine-protein kinase
MKQNDKPYVEKINRYEIVRTIGRGGFSTVYLGTDPYINRSVALKVSNTQERKGKDTTLARLFQEAEAAGRLIHPNIVTIYDAGIQEPRCYIAMEYIEGATLHKNCKPEHLLPVADIIDIIIKVCDGLDYAHQRGIIHRDIKPSNILIGKNGDIKIADFGLACFADLVPKEKRTVGTPSYMPPEQVRGDKSTPESDLFSVGVILYLALCGKKPFEAESSLEMRHKIVNEPHIPLSRRNPELPKALTTITDRALSKKPEDRYRSGFDLARDLESVLKGEDGPIDGQLGKRIRGLKTLSFFEDFSEEEIVSLINIGTWISKPAGEVIVHEKESGGSFFVISSGNASVLIGNKAIGELHRGDSFGEMSFLLGRKRSATISALDKCEMLRLNSKKIDILKPKTQIKLYRIFARSIAGYLVRSNEAGS